MTATASAFSRLVAMLDDVEAAFDLDRAIARVREAVDADAAALLRDGAVTIAHGLVAGRRSGELLTQLATGSQNTATIPGLGRAHVARVSMARADTTLLLMRRSAPFDDETLDLARACGRLVDLSLRLGHSIAAERSASKAMQRRADDRQQLVDQLRERQHLLDRLFRIQRSISHRAPTHDVLESITSGASELLGVEKAALRLRDKHATDELVLVSATGVDSSDDDPDDLAGAVVTLSDPVGGLAFSERRLVIAVNPSRSRDPIVEGCTAMAAPVHVNGEPVGCLIVSDSDLKRRFSSPEQEVLLAFAEHASLALQDARAHDEMRSALRRERHRADHDPLTGLPNRASVQRHLDAILKRGGRARVSVLFVDLDRFKLINDTLGHAFGDEVLREIARRLSASVREPDTVARLSGDEFVLICDQMSQYGAIEMATRIQQKLSEPIERRGGAQTVTTSIGIATAVDGDDAESLIANADLAMYRAKQGGRSRVELFDRDIREAVETRLEVGRDLRRALDEDELLVYVQPLVSLPSRRVVGFESLVRWEHPERGIVAPDDFVGLAEETGQVLNLDRAVLRTTLELLQGNPTSRPIAVNLAARSFGDANLVPWLRARFNEYEVDPRSIKLEVTESALMDQASFTANQLVELGEMGVDVMIDDFGTGYSSLAYLQTFAVAGVKVDRAFVGRLGVDPRADAVVAAVFHMAEALDLTVVTEGIETDEQVQRLVELRDCSPRVELWAQGYMFGRPAPGREVLDGFVELPLAPTGTG